jgi:hypothetical protein
MSPNLEIHSWGTVSSGFREIEIGWDRLGSVGLLAPILAPRKPSITRSLSTTLPTWARGEGGHRLVICDERDLVSKGLAVLPASARTEIKPGRRK